jgi:hypothetical protein
MEAHMNWYAIQVMTGKEAQVVADLKDHGKEVTDFYKEKQDLRVEGMMIRLCGN